MPNDDRPRSSEQLKQESRPGCVSVFASVRSSRVLISTLPQMFDVHGMGLPYTTRYSVH